MGVREFGRFLGQPRFSSTTPPILRPAQREHVPGAGLKQGAAACQADAAEELRFEASLRAAAPEFVPESFGFAAEARAGAGSAGGGGGGGDGRGDGA